MTGRCTRWERWLPGSGGRLKVLNWNLLSLQLLEIIQVLDSISWVRCASGNVCKSVSENLNCFVANCYQKLNFFLNLICFNCLAIKVFYFSGVHPLTAVSPPYCVTSDVSLSMISYHLFAKAFLFILTLLPNVDYIAKLWDRGFITMQLLLMRMERLHHIIIIIVIIVI